MVIHQRKDFNEAFADPPHNNNILRATLRATYLIHLQ
jgi:hypothetical protein